MILTCAPSMPRRDERSGVQPPAFRWFLLRPLLTGWSTWGLVTTIFTHSTPPTDNRFGGRLPAAPSTRLRRWRTELSTSVLTMMTCTPSISQRDNNYGVERLAL